MLLQLTDVTFGYQGQELFEGLTWQINEGDRVGLVGPNGCGKSTLLRLMTGELAPDGGGTVAKRRGLRIGYLRQALHDRPEETLLEALLEPFSEVPAALRQQAELAAGKIRDLGAPRFGREHQHTLSAMHPLRDIQGVKQYGATQIRSVVCTERFQ